MKQLFTLLALFFTLSTFAQTIVVVKDSDVGSDTTRWTKDNTYHLDGYIFVESGGVLIIEPGTVIKGLATPSTGDVSSALIITRGAKILAEGTAEEPIILTAELDDVSNPNDLTQNDRGLWGGLIILGHGIVGVDGGTSSVEGIPSTEGRADYGGTDNQDNSGILKYVSVRHGGDKLEANNEINGISFAGVGSGTEVDYVEVYANLDDGIELFGGAVNVKHATIAFCGDDAFDYDQSWDGKGQFWFVVQDIEGARGGEWDGSEAADLLPKVSPMISNMTFIGDGLTTVNSENNDALIIRNDAAAHVYNSVFTGFARRAITLDNTSWQRFLDGDITFTNNTFSDFVAGNTFETIVSAMDVNAFAAHLAGNGNTIESPMLGGISRTNDGGLDPRLSAGSPALTGATLVSDDYFDPVPYRGAFGNRDNWLNLWTALFQNGHLGDLVIPNPAPIVTVRDSDINAGENITWSADNVYLLDGYVFVEDGACLNIPAGTVIKGKASPSTGDKSSALIITRGACIMAEGRADAPIVMTAEFDDVENRNDLTQNDRGLWGGLIILGRSIVGVDGGEFNVEGIPSSEGRALYGGTDPEDNSGVLRYVSVRHGGDKLEANNEINGITLAGVGRGTEVDYIEVYANLDDGIELFGGTVNVKHAIMAFGGDDAFDYDQSWDGKGQFWFVVQDIEGARAGEWDGSEAANLEPKVAPVISNMTVIGGGTTTVNPENNDALIIRNDAAVHVYNSILTGFARRAITLQDNSWPRFLNGDITFTNNLFSDFVAGNDFASIVSAMDVNAFVNHLTSGNNAIATPVLGGISRTNDAGLDPRISAGSPALSGAVLISDDYFDPVPYRGAFNNRDNWALGWTALDKNGHFGDLVVPAPVPVVTIRDADLVAGQTYNWTADNIYLLDGYVFLENGGTLNIAPGTVIKGKASPSTGDKSSALVITRGATINAIGTDCEPIIMTAEFDDTTDPDDLTQNDRGLWGGLIILGNGVVGVDGGEFNVEGIPSNEGRALYGGNNNDDNSGTLKYVSIRHGGDKLEANNEINGLTLGGVGRGTTLEHVEVFANLDDGVEFFGGAAQLRWAVMAFCGDDGYDFDQSWDGKGQFWFLVQDIEGARGGEWDGSERADLGPKVAPMISHMTFIGDGTTTVNPENNDALIIRNDAAAHVYNSIMTGFARRAITLSDNSWQRFLDGDITFTNNLFFDNVAGATLAENVSAMDVNAFVAHLQANNNRNADPEIAGISRVPDQGLDPRVQVFGEAYNASVDVADPWFLPARDIGAFGDENWADCWSALSQMGYFGDIVAVDDPVLSVTDESMTIYPNPASEEVNVAFELPTAAELRIVIVDISGKTVQVSNPVQFEAGKTVQSVDVSGLSKGMYLITLQSGDSILGRRIMIKHD